MMIFIMNWLNMVQIPDDPQVVKTPKGTPLELPGKAVAEAVANEWQEQTEDILPLEMPYTTLGILAMNSLGSPCNTS